MSQALYRWASLRFLLIGTLCLTGAAAFGCAAASAADAPAAAQPAKWVRKELQFTYMGFSTRYSCEGLREQVAKVLVQLGARRQDMKVHSMGCVRAFGHPEPAPTVRGTFYVLEPVPASHSGAAQASTVPAHWQAVHVELASSRLQQAAQCELLEQIKQRIVPLFTVRHVKFTSNCMPYHLSLPGATLELEVLKPDHQAGKKEH